jgi:urocanate hydratase
MRGATWVSLHNGGGTGWGKAINGGFGMVLDGSKATDIKTTNMLFWDVANGLTRRARAGNPNALKTIERLQKAFREEKGNGGYFPFIPSI